ncbi:hypothetical protein [Amycolatopsis sp. VC5-11]|uniref:hypothetical protein n=1 Tax=Amycolatopsis sp. VC5-11 TaxID=3120156 RepID=UPI003009EBA9
MTDGVFSGYLGPAGPHGEDLDATVVFAAVSSHPEETGVHARHGDDAALRCSDCAHGNHDDINNRPQGAVPANVRSHEWAGRGARLTRCACTRCNCSSTILTLSPAPTDGGRHHLRTAPGGSSAEEAAPADEQSTSASGTSLISTSERAPTRAELRAAVLADAQARDPQAAAAMTAARRPSIEIMQAVRDGLKRL